MLWFVLLVTLPQLVVPGDWCHHLSAAASWPSLRCSIYLQLNVSLVSKPVYHFKLLFMVSITTDLHCIQHIYSVPTSCFRHPLCWWQFSGIFLPAKTAHILSLIFLMCCQFTNFLDLWVQWCLDKWRLVLINSAFFNFSFEVNKFNINWSLHF